MQKLTPVQERILTKLFPEMLAFFKQVYLRAVATNEPKALEAVLIKYDEEATPYITRLMSTGINERDAEQLFVDYVKDTDPEFSKLLNEMLEEDNIIETLD